MPSEDEVLAQKTTDELFDEIARRYDGLLMVTSIRKSDQDCPVQIRGKGDKILIIGLAVYTQTVFVRDLLQGTRGIG